MLVKKKTCNKIKLNLKTFFFKKVRGHTIMMSTKND